MELAKAGLATRDILTAGSIRNAMAVHAASGGGLFRFRNEDLGQHDGGGRRHDHGGEQVLDLDRRRSLDAQRRCLLWSQVKNDCACRSLRLRGTGMIPVPTSNITIRTAISMADRLSTRGRC